MLKRRIGIFLVAAFAISMIASFAYAGTSPGVIKEDLNYIMPLSEVHAGMKGYGLTVFKGSKIEKFNVEVLGILRKANNGKDQIFVRLIGGPVTERKANIIQGMSGSPVYVNGRIIGAVAYGPGAFSREPLGMLTPIEDMLDSLDPKLPAHPSGLSSTASSTTQLNTPLNIDGEIINRIEFRDSASAGTTPAKGTLVMTQLMTPIMVSGMSSRGITGLTNMFAPYGMLPMAGPGAKADPVQVELKPGSSVGMALVTGDIDMTGVGTVTYRRGNKIVAFGHPMLEVGPIDAPMTTAWVHDVYPDYNVSFKIASPMKTVGRIFEDRPWSIGGEIGKMPKMIPVTVDVDDKAIGRKRTLNVKVVNHPALAPKLILSVASEAIAQVHGIPGDAMATVDLTIDADQVGKIERKNIFFNPSEIEVESMDDLQGLLSILAGNRFHPVDVKSVHMTVKIESGRKTADIERIFIPKNEYQPGETINVGVDLRPYKGEKFTKYIKVKLPEDTPDSKLSLKISGGIAGGDSQTLALSAIDGDTAKAAPAPGGGAENIRQIIDKYLERDQNNDLVARLQLPTMALNVGGEKLTDLPDSIANVMKSPKATGLKLERDEIKTVEPMDCIVTGSQSLTIKVERQQTGEKPASDQPQAVPSAPQTASLASAEDASPVPDGSEAFYASRATESPELSNVPMAEASVTPKIEKKSASVTTKPANGNAVKSEAAPGAKAPEAKPEQSPAASSEEKPVGRQPSVWNQSSLKEFSAGKFESTAATDANDIRLIPAMDKLSDLSADYVWQVIPDGNGGAFAGTGSSGLIYRINKNGANSVFFKTGELQVHSLARDSKGNVYAGTSPNGKIFQISPDGKGKVVFDAEQKYIVALAVDDSDNVYAATGDAGIIYKITPSGQAKEFVKLPKSSVLSLTVGKTGNLYAGTGNGGVVFEIMPDGTASPIYNASEDSVTCLAADGLGNIYAGTGSSKGIIYRISPSGMAKPVFDRAPHALSLVTDHENNVYVASDEEIYKILPDETTAALDARNSGAQFVSLAITPDGALFAGTANMGSVYSSIDPVNGTYTSPVHDAGLTAKWGRISWIAQNPEGSSIMLQTRSGSISKPDNSWSAWSAAYTNASGQEISSPAGRYIQYRAFLSGSNAASPVLDQVNISYLTENRAPMVSINEPAAGSIVSKTQTIKWTALDPDKDSLSYDLYYSADEGKTWHTLTSGIKQSGEAAPAPAKPEAQQQARPKSSEVMSIDLGALLRSSKNESEVLAKIKAELDKHPEITPEAKAQILAQAPAAIAKVISASAGQTSQPAAKPAGSSSGNGSTRQTNYSWDTTKVPDGSYMVKVVASDRVSNAVGFLTGEKVVGPITISNKPPKVEVYKKDAKISPDRCVSFNGSAYHDSIAIVGVQYRIDNGDWMAAAATDGIFDSPSEQFTVETQPIDLGKHTVEVKAIDAAGNSNSIKFPLEIVE
ncbi:MAG: SpoIVB peptidase S55 domain-containing protein [Armatimonadota bacterium]